MCVRASARAYRTVYVDYIYTYMNIENGKSNTEGQESGETRRPFSVKRSAKTVSSFFFQLAWPVQIHVMPLTIVTNYRLRGIETRNDHGTRKTPQILQTL